MTARVEVVDPFETADPDAPDRMVDTLAAARARITDVDTRLIALLARRMDLARALRGVKAEADMPTYDPTREASVIRHAASEGGRHGLPEEDVRELFWRIVKMSRDAQEEA